jgi:signal transduction histidine kinase
MKAAEQAIQDLVDWRKSILTPQAYTFPRHRYMVAGFVVVGALVATLQIDPIVEGVTFLLMLGAVTFCAWYGGLGPGLLALGVSLLGSYYFVLPALPAAGSYEIPALARVALFTVIAIWVVVLTASRTRAMVGLGETNSALQHEIAVRKRVEDALCNAHDTLEGRVKERTAELEDANRALADQARALLAANAELERFAYVASHDLQEPLRTVGSYVKLLTKRYRSRLDSDADEFIQYIADGVERMQQLIRDLLVYCSCRLKKVESVDCQALLAKVMANLQPAIHESAATVSYQGLPVIMGDAAQLEQVFQNLIGNGLKYRGEKPPRIHISARRQGQQYLFAVEDNGIGIEPQYLERIFIVFQRLHTKAEYPGTGIGLAICKKIVEAHKGRLWVESHLGRGSKFYFTLPVFWEMNQPARRAR